MTQDLTHGSISRGLMRFSLPLIAGNLLQQCYNLADTWVVGRFLGEAALGAVGSAFALMVLLTSLLTGLCMGSGVVLSTLWGENRPSEMRTAGINAFSFIALTSLVLTLGAYLALEGIMMLLRVPDEAAPFLRTYLNIVLAGLPFVFLYNFFAAALRSVGNSSVPLLFLLLSTVVNIALDLYLVPVAGWGVAGAAWATVLAQGLSALGIALYALLRVPCLRPRREEARLSLPLLQRLAGVSLLTSLQQSIMNFGILMIQSLVNSYGVATMAAFAAGVKIDALAYAPAQDFANGFATFVAQNRGAGQPQRVRKGIRTAAALSLSFCLVVSVCVFLFAQPLLSMFLAADDPESLNIGVQYLRMEGIFYPLIGLLFLLYAIYRGMERAGMSVVLTVISLGLRVALAYAFAPLFGVTAIWLSIPVGWLIADVVGVAGLLRRHSEKKFS